MFTIEQINKVHKKFGSADTLLKYAHELHKLGVISFNSYVADGHSEYLDENGYVVNSPPYHDVFTVADVSDKEAFDNYMKLSEEGKISYEEMSRKFAESGVEKWTMDTNKATFTYFDKAGNVLLIEKLS